jgi:hypothetical protein
MLIELCRICTCPGDFFLTGRTYYLTTLDHWQHNAARFVNSHYVRVAGIEVAEGATAQAKTLPTATTAQDTEERTQASPSILVVVDADEGTHNDLERSGWLPLPHPLSLKPIPPDSCHVLAGRGIAPGATTLDVAEAFAQVHPLLRHRVF